MKGAHKNQCPCCSGKPFKSCCEPFLKDEKKPETAEHLMRSRYTAFVLKDMEYIANTQAENAADGFDLEEAKKSANHAKWCGLSIIDPGKKNGSDKDEVEFCARYIAGDQLHLLHERSQFKKINGQWFYTSGTLIPHTPIAIKSNQACPCGSKKKYSQCCFRE